MESGFSFLEKEKKRKEKKQKVNKIISLFHPVQSLFIFAIFVLNINQ